MTAAGRVLRNQTRGITGALVVSGVTILLTAETWRLARERPGAHLILYSVVGLGVVLTITRTSGFRVEEENENGSRYDPLRLATDFAQLVLQSVLAAMAVLWMYGIVGRSAPAHVLARMVLLQVVPLGFGAALANRLLHEMEDEQDKSADRQNLLTNVAVFAGGAIFFALPLGASIEMNVLAAAADWQHLAAIVVVSLVVTYLILYELEFRGQSGRTVDHELATFIHAGQVCIVYAVGLVVSTVLLWGFGYLSLSPSVDAQKLVVLSFPTTVGGAAARVIL